MSFFSQQAVRCLGDQFQYCLLIGCIKTAKLKRQRFGDSESDTTEPRASKCLRVDVHDNEEGKGSDEYHSKGNRYVPLSPLPQKKSNRPTNLGEGIRSLNHFVCIPKLPHQVIANFALEFLGGEDLKAKKKCILATCERGWNLTRLPQLPQLSQLPESPTSVA